MKIKVPNNTTAVDVALNLTGSIAGFPGVLAGIPAGRRVGFDDLPEGFDDVPDPGQTWTPDIVGMELDLDLPTYNTRAVEKAPFTTDLHGIETAWRWGLASNEVMRTLTYKIGSQLFEYRYVLGEVVTLRDRSDFDVPITPYLKFLGWAEKLSDNNYGPFLEQVEMTRDITVESRNYLGAKNLLIGTRTFKNLGNSEYPYWTRTFGVGELILQQSTEDQGFIDAVMYMLRFGGERRGFACQRPNIPMEIGKRYRLSFTCDTLKRATGYLNQLLIEFDVDRSRPPELYGLLDGDGSDIRVSVTDRFSGEGVKDYQITKTVPRLVLIGLGSKTVVRVDVKFTANVNVFSKMPFVLSSDIYEETNRHVSIRTRQMVLQEEDGAIDKWVPSMDDEVSEILG